MQSKPLKNEFEIDVPKMGTLVTPGTEMCPPMFWLSGYGVRLAIWRSLVRIQLPVVPFTPNCTDASPRVISSRSLEESVWNVTCNPNIIGTLQ